MSSNQFGSLSGLSPKFSTKIKSSETKFPCPNATRALVALMNQHAVIGGAAAHWGGPSAFAEIMSALFGIFSEELNHWKDSFNFVNDAGHTENGLYAIHANYGLNEISLEDLKGFRSITSKLTGHGENHLYPEGVLLSNGPLGSSVAQAEGLAIADKIHKKERVTILTISDGATMEGEAKEAFSSIPGFAHKDKLSPFIMIVSNNNTKLSGRINEDSFSLEPSFNSLSLLGWETIFVDDGHDLQSLYHTFKSAISKAKQNPRIPIAIVVKTIKGKGIKATEISNSGGHGYPLKAFDPNLVDFIGEIYDGAPPEEFTSWAKNLLQNEKREKSELKNLFKNSPQGKIQLGISKALIALKREGLPIVSVTADLAGSTGVAGFQKEYPELTFDVGVAESNMVSIAAGLSKSNFIPVVDTFAQFGITKGNLPLIMANLSNAPIIGIFSHTGYQDAADGASHQSTTYLSAVSSIPQTDVINLSNCEQAEQVLLTKIREFSDIRKQGGTPNSLIFFLGRENFPYNYGTELFDNQVYAPGKDALLVCSGPMVRESLEARAILKEEGISLTVFENIFINKPNIQKLTSVLDENRNILITAEDHQLQGGMGSYLTHHLLKNGSLFKYLGLGIDGSFGRSAYKAGHLYENMGLSANKIAKKIKNFILEG